MSLSLCTFNLNVLFFVQLQYFYSLSIGRSDLEADLLCCLLLGVLASVMNGFHLGIIFLTAEN